MTLRERLAAVLAPDVLAAIEELVDERVSAELARRAEAVNGEAPEWLTLEQAAERLGCSYDAMRMRAKRRRYGEVRHDGRCVYVRAANVNADGGA